MHIQGHEYRYAGLFAALLPQVEVLERLGLDGRLPPLSTPLFAPGASCYDLNYGLAHEALAQWCSDNDVTSHDGLGMLVEQAAESFRIWTGQQPDTKPVIETLRAESRAP